MLPNSLVSVSLENGEMVWLFIEMAVGFALFVFLVWWTLPRKNKSSDHVKVPEKTPGGPTD